MAYVLKKGFFMNFLKKCFLFALIILPAGIQAAHMFQDKKKQGRKMSLRSHEELKEIDHNTIEKEELFIVIDPTENYAKLAILEEKTNGKFEVTYFTLLHPNKSAEMSDLKEAQVYLQRILLKPISKEEKTKKQAHKEQTPFRPMAPKSKGQDWRKVPSSRKGSRQ